MSEPEISVWLRIASDTRTPDELSALLGLRCDESWKVGEKRKYRTDPSKDNGWILHSGLPQTVTEVESHLENLLTRVRPCADKIRKLSETEEVAVVCAIYTDPRLVLDFDGTLIAGLSQLGAGFGIDVYVVPR